MAVQSIRAPRSRLSFVAAVLLAASASAFAVDVKVTLSGDQEVPPVKSVGTGSGFFAISKDKKITGQVNVAGIKPVAAHIHEGAPGTSGPVVIPLVRTGPGDSYNVPANTTMSEAVYKAFEAGKLYVNVHTEANPGGELRGQLKP